MSKSPKKKDITQYKREASFRNIEFEYIETESSEEEISSIFKILFDEVFEKGNYGNE
jgi:hypothetical protein